jgi:secreted trypsin-like serine protease
MVMAGAVLIGPRFVLSAAHCEAASQNFMIGALSDPNTDGRKVAYESYVVHPDYRDDKYGNDIMLYYLKENVTDIPYLTMERKKIDTVGQPMTVIGFGDTVGEGGARLSLSDYLQEVEVGYVDYRTCAVAHEDLVTADMLCATEHNKDACYGE